MLLAFDNSASKSALACDFVSDEAKRGAGSIPTADAESDSRPSWELLLNKAEAEVGSEGRKMGKDGNFAVRGDKTERRERESDPEFDPDPEPDHESGTSKSERDSLAPLAPRGSVDSFELKERGKDDMAGERVSLEPRSVSSVSTSRSTSVSSPLEPAKGGPVLSALPNSGPEAEAPGEVSDLDKGRAGVKDGVLDRRAMPWATASRARLRKRLRVGGAGSSDKNESGGGVSAAAGGAVVRKKWTRSLVGEE